MCSSGDNILAAELATEATSLWSLGQHDPALQTLQRLEGLLPSDPKVQINEWLTGYYADSNTRIETLTGQLAAWLDKHGPVDAVHRTAYTTAAINYGILMYVQQQHNKALAVLEPLYSGVESVHGGAALCLCVVLLEIYFGSSQLPKAAQVLHYLQAAAAPDMPARAAFSDDVTDDASTSQARDAEQQWPAGTKHEQLLHSPKQTPKKLPPHAVSPSRLQQQPQMSPKQPVDQQVDRQQQQRQQQQEQEEEQLGGPLTLDLPMVTRCTSAFMQQVAKVVGHQGGQITSVDTPALLHMYKARLAIACSNHKAAKKEVKALLALQPGSLTAMLLKSQLEVMRQQPKKALKTLAPVLSAVADCSTRCKLQLLNVLAVIHQQLGKHQVAALYLSTALAQHQQAQDKQEGPQHLQGSHQQQAGKQQQSSRTGKQQHGKKQQKGGNNTVKNTGAEADAPETSAAAGNDMPPAPRDRWQLLLDSSDALQYNMGLQQLALHNWQAAFECFEVASCKYYTHPQLWLRMAEASISLYHEQQEAQQAPQQQQQQQLLGLIYIGQQESMSSGSSSKSSGSTGKHAAGSAGSSLLQQAAEQLSTGLALLRQQQAEAAKQAEEAAAAVTAAAVAAAAAGEQPLISPAAAMASTSGLLSSSVPQLSLFSQGYYMPDAAVHASAGAADAAGGSSSAAAAAAGDVAAVAASAGITPLGACILAPATSALQQALLANQAYVQLLRQQPQQALEAAKALLACSSMSPQQHYLGSCYAAEALCMLGRTDEAAEQLQGHIALYMSSSQVNSSGGASGTATPSSSVAAVKAAAISDFGGNSTPAVQHVVDWPAIAAGTGVAGGPLHAGSIMSDDDSSCMGCKGGGICGVGPNQPGAGSSTHRDSQVAVLCNMASVLAVQGDVQESRRYAAMAVAQDPNCAAANVVLGWSGLLEAGRQHQQQL